nr:GEVED domain-containing protein [uncultured Flavobacterium sp.]
MKKTLLTVVIILATTLISRAQNSCLTDEMQKKAVSKDFILGKQTAPNSTKSPSLDVEKFLLSKGFSTDKTGAYNGKIYTIPVVVHIIVPNNEAVGTQFNPSDVEIQTWIDNCNKILNTTYGDFVYPEGNGLLDGTVMPFKLVLAKRTESCEATTGIVRHYASETTLPNYATYGLDDTKGVTADQVRTFAPHWSEASYFNIYVINGFKGNFNGGDTGFSGLPKNEDKSYDAFMTCRVTTKLNAFNISILPHEIGHAVGLEHTFSKDYDFTTSPCPVAETAQNCLTVNDYVCDTAPCKPYLNPLPDNTIINPCTGSTYDGIQYNMMGYNSGRKFTLGQRERAITEFLGSRENLTLSLGATPIEDNTGGGTVSNASCEITSTNNASNFWLGPTLVQLGTINNVSLPRKTSSQVFYTDFTKKNCINPSVYTDLNIGQTYTLQVGIVGNSQYINAWIDYNNNGSFEASELVVTSGIKITPTNGFTTNTIWSATVTPPSTATINKPLRLRVRTGDEIGACDATKDGQVEDYSVTLRTSLGIKEEQSAEAKNIIWYSKNENKLMSNSVLGNYRIFDVSGRLVQEGNNDSKEITLNFNPIGVYIFQNETINMKFTKQ